MVNLFEKDAYIKEFETIIQNIDKENKTIELENTAFYAKGGGQPGDTGFIEIDGEKIEILDTFKKENSKICHLVKNLKNAEKNKTIKGVINWKKRFKHMQMHSALDELCSIIPLGVTGGQIAYEKSRLDFNAQNIHR